MLPVLYLRTILLISGLYVHRINSAPTTLQPRVQNGPCIGMDCLHGILMHGDDTKGEAHKGQDAYEKLQRQDAVKNVVSGPCQGADCMEKLSHPGQDPDVVHKMNKKPGPQKQEEAGPCQGMDCLHGVLMHGDEEQGARHVLTDEQRLAEETAKHAGKVPKVDPDSKLHGAEGHEVHDPSKVKNSDEDDETDVHLKRDTVLSMEHMLHGNNDVDHSKDKKVEPQVYPESLAGKNLETLLHGSDDAHDIHQKARTPDSVMENAGKAGVLDPHSIIHGDYKIGNGGLGPDDNDDYKTWKAQQEKEENDEKYKDGYTFAYVADTILSEIDMLKRRYLPRFWDSEEEVIGDGEIGPLDIDVFQTTDGPEFEEGDMRHELVNIGSVKPISETHKIRTQEHAILEKRKEMKEKHGSKKSEI